MVVIATLFVLWQVRPNLIFANTTPTGLDLGGHVWAPAFLRDYILPSGRLAGWSPWLFGGLPAYVLYPVLPAVFIVVLGSVVHYGVAIKIVVALPLVLFPAAGWSLGRWSKLPDPVPACLALATLAFLFDSSYVAAGGNLASDLAGEFSYTLGLVFLVVALGLLDVVCRTGRRRTQAAGAAAICFLCHPVTGLVLLVGGLALVAAHSRTSGREAFVRVLPVGVVTALLAATWWLPFIWYRGQLTGTVNPRQTNWATLFFPLPAFFELIVMGLAITGVVFAVQKRQPMMLTFTTLAIVAAVGLFVLPAGVLVNVRMEPVWHLSRFLLAGYAAAELLRRAPGPWQARAVTWGPISCAAVVVFILGINTGSLPGTTTRITQTAKGDVQRSSWLFLPSVATSLDPVYVRYGFGGYERYFHAAEYHALVNTMTEVGRRYGCGRAFDEFEPTGRYGSIYELSILPYWTDGCIDGMAAVVPDQSWNTPFIVEAQESLSTYVDLTTGSIRQRPLDVAQGVELLRTLGVRYYVSWSPEAQAQAATVAGLKQIASSGRWKIYEVVASNLVAGLSVQPVVVGSRSEAVWDKAAGSWFTADDNQRPPPATGGPASWQRVAPGQPGPVVRVAVVRVADPPVVSAVRTSTNRISFHVDRTGEAVVVRASSFPWWSAIGAIGPWRLAPDNLVVVPTSHEVTLTATPKAPDNVGEVIGVLGLLGLVGLGFVDWARRRRRRFIEAPAVAQEATSVQR